MGDVERGCKGSAVDRLAASSLLSTLRAATESAVAVTHGCAGSVTGTLSLRSSSFVRGTAGIGKIPPQHQRGVGTGGIDAQPALPSDINGGMHKRAGDPSPLALGIDFGVIDGHDTVAEPISQFANLDAFVQGDDATVRV